jgi:hypothetical protein
VGGTTGEATGGGLTGATGGLAGEGSETTEVTSTGFGDDTTAGGTGSTGTALDPANPDPSCEASTFASADGVEYGPELNAAATSDDRWAMIPSCTVESTAFFDTVGTIDRYATSTAPTAAAMTRGRVVDPETICGTMPDATNAAPASRRNRPDCSRTTLHLAELITASPSI